MKSFRKKYQRGSWSLLKKDLRWGNLDSNQGKNFIKDE
jgi:hypothetical protein